MIVLMSLAGLAALSVIAVIWSVMTPRTIAVSYTHLRAHETKANLVCRLLLELHLWQSVARLDSSFPPPFIKARM